MGCYELCVWPTNCEGGKNMPAETGVAPPALTFTNLLAEKGSWDIAPKV